jgi:hypothetical protein
MVQNGFIPEAVVENGRRFCEKMGTELVVLSVANEFIPVMRELMNDDFTKGYPCYRCGDMFHAEIRQFCVEHRINRVILGRNWWRWIEPEVRSVRWMEDVESGLKMQFMSLPFALQLTNAEVIAALADAGWEPVTVHGNSTNCLIPGLVEYGIQQRLGYHPELNLLSREVISGYLSKEEARAHLGDVRDLTASLHRLVDGMLAEEVLSPRGLQADPSRITRSQALHPEKPG